ncbi:MULTISPECIES: DMT family transporter [Brasilonema]|nr:MULTISPECIES: DMT family transporter [Brasilonema]
MLANFSDLFLMNFKGELAALGVAFLWALTSVIYSRLGKKIFPLAMNLSKGAIAIAMAFLTILLSGEQLLPAIDSIRFILLLLSGAVGIGIGDTAYFAALNNLGARRTLLLKTLGPPMAAIVSTIFLHEQLSYVAWVGILLIILGVAWVISERVKNATTNDKLIVGVSFALLSAFTDAMGAVLSRAALAETTINSLWSAMVRLVGGVLILLLWLPMKREPVRASLKELRSGRILGIVILCAFLSTYLGFWLQQISLKFSPAAIAKSLNATSPLFVLPFAFFIGEKISLRAILGVLVAIAGMGLLFIYR